MEFIGTITEGLETVEQLDTALHRNLPCIFIRPAARLGEPVL
ncbi:MAG: hypothetical protein ACI9W2_003678 [Gammaproteobacteria bacterium]|jgi:hypothetical protein